MPKTYTHKEVKNLMDRAYKRGYIKGMTCFAWWKEGKQYLGNGRYTLSQAIEKLEEEGLYNYSPDFDNMNILMDYESEVRENDDE